MAKKTRVVVDRRKCKKSGECFNVCPHNAISVKKGKAWIDPEKCDKDGICIPACPNFAIYMEEYEE